MKDNLTEFNTGGSHAENPLGGIPQGVAQDGQMNTVEEGETKVGNYVYSDRLRITKSHVKKFNLPKYLVGKTYAEGTKLIEKRFEGREDNASNSTKDVFQARMTESQEYKKEEIEAAEYDMSVEELREVKAQEAAEAQEQQAQQQAQMQAQKDQQSDPNMQGGPGGPPGGEVPQNATMQPSQQQFEGGGVLSTAEGQGSLAGSAAGMYSSMDGDLAKAKGDSEVRDKMNVGGTTAKYALMGAAAGSVVPGIGTAIGAGVGAVAGATMAMTNNSKVAGEQQSFDAKLQGQKLLSQGYAAAYGGYQDTGDPIKKKNDGTMATAAQNTGNLVDQRSLNVLTPTDLARVDYYNATQPNQTGFQAAQSKTGLDYIERSIDRTYLKQPQDYGVEDNPNIPYVYSDPETGYSQVRKPGHQYATGGYMGKTWNPNFNINENPGEMSIANYIDESRTAEDEAALQAQEDLLYAQEGQALETEFGRDIKGAQRAINKEGRTGRMIGYGALGANLAPFIGNLGEGMALEQDEPIRYDRVGRTYTPQFADVQRQLNAANEAYAGVDGAIANATNGNIGAYRSSMLGASVNEAKSRFDAYNAINDINRAEEAKLNEDYAIAARENVELSNLEKENALKDKAAYDAAKRSYRVAAYEGLGKMGKEMFKINQYGDTSSYSLLNGGKKKNQNQVG